MFYRILPAIFLLLAAFRSTAQTSTGNGTYLSVLKIPALNNSPDYIYINTSIPADGTSAPQLQIIGYTYYGSNKAVRMVLSWYYYNDSFYWSQFYSDLGYRKPSRVRLGKYSKDGSYFVRVEIANDGMYWTNYTISATDRDNYSSFYTGWTYAEGEMPTSTTSQILTVPQQKDVVVDGSLGVGIADPTSVAQILRYEGTNRTTYSDILTISSKAGTLPFDGHGGGILFNGSNYQNNNGIINYARIGSTINSNSFSNNGSDLFFDVAPTSSGDLQRALTIKYSGKVGIGTSDPSEMLSVNGNIKTRKVIVSQNNWPDYVFDKDYKLRSLSTLEAFITQNRHLPEIPSAKEIEEKGISVGDNQSLLLKKIEELTLYIIQQQKQINALQRSINTFKSRFIQKPASHR